MSHIIDASSNASPDPVAVGQAVQTPPEASNVGAPDASALPVTSGSGKSIPDQNESLPSSAEAPSAAEGDEAAETAETSIPGVSQCYELFSFSYCHSIQIS
jgi:hypothetical protein